MRYCGCSDGSERCIEPSPLASRQKALPSALKMMRVSSSNGTRGVARRRH
jgi:hypothetical protein